MNTCFRIITLGCKVNQYDGQNIREKLVKAGLREAAKGESVDLCVINTCTVTAKADKDSLYAVHRSRRENPGAIIAFTGCAAASAGAVPEADIIIPGTRKRRLVAILKRRFPALIPTTARVGTAEAISSFKGRTRAFLKIQDGCDNFCSFCKISLVRGPLSSKPLEQAVREAGSLVANGYQEIVLTGICLGKYRTAKGEGLIDVIDALERIPGLRRIRLSSIEAPYVTGELTAKLARGGKLCPHLHIPLQSGDDGVLQRMNRAYSSKDFLALVRRLKRRIPGFAFTTDVIVGFPGETEEQFGNSLKMIGMLNPLKVHVFPYSPRQSTRAAALPARVPAQEIRRRARCMAAAAEEESRRFREQFIGTHTEVLVEGAPASRPGYWQAYTANYIPVLIPSHNRIGNTFREARLVSLEGECMIAGA